MLTSYRTSPQQNLWLQPLIVDNFAGGGGASTGMEDALGRPVDIAINHDPDAIAMHAINHPHTKHYCESVWDINPREVTNGQQVGLAWFSPDCKHFSKAKGGTPVNKNIRALAWVTKRWADTVRPHRIMLENVEEFVGWGPVVNGKPCLKRKGRTFNNFVGELREIGYDVEWRNLRASSYGAPTTRNRFFLVARCDDEQIMWPSATHGSPLLSNFKQSGLKKWRTAAEIIDWSIPTKSIFDRSKPLVDNSLRRIATGIPRFVIDDPQPFIVRTGQQGFGGDGMQYSLDQPLTTITTKQEHYLITPILAKHLAPNQVNFKVQARANEVRAFLIKYYSTGGQWARIDEPLHTITSNDRLALVLALCGPNEIVDIHYRILEPRELFLAQGFPRNYIIDRDCWGNSIPKYKQVARCGNSVCPALAKALVLANYITPQQLLRAA